MFHRGEKIQAAETGFPCQCRVHDVFVSRSQYFAYYPIPIFFYKGIPFPLFVKLFNNYRSPHSEVIEKWQDGYRTVHEQFNDELLKVIYY